MDGDDRQFYVRLDAALTDFIRLARHPLLTERVSAGIDPAIDRRLLVLLNLIADRGPVRAADLVDVLAVDQSTVSRQLSALEQHDLVVRTADPRDRRAALVAVTPSGHAAIAIARGAWQEALAEITASWPEDRREELLRMFRDMADALATIVPSAAIARRA